MLLRAFRKTSSLLPHRKHTRAPPRNEEIPFEAPLTAAVVLQTLDNNPCDNLQRQRNLLTCATNSNPELHRATVTVRGTIATEDDTQLRRTSSLNGLRKKCLKNKETTTESLIIKSKLNQIPVPAASSNSAERCDVIASASSGTITLDCPSTAIEGDTADLSPTSRRMQEYNLKSNGAAYPLPSSISMFRSPGDSVAVVRVPIMGYEVMEARERFTVYKLRVDNPITFDSWMVLRRYTDFERLHTKLKQVYPHIPLPLPPKNIFGDNFSALFLDNRLQGLQMFVNCVLAKEELRRLQIVRDFFCLDEPPTYSESVEDYKAIFEIQNDMIANLKFQIRSKNDLISQLQRQLSEALKEKKQRK